MAIQGSLSPANPIKGSVGGSDSIQAKSMTYTPTAKLADLTDIDVTEREEGSLILWDETTQTFKVKSTVENNNTFIVGGSF
jgi:hypothetical protein